jgi:uncharacterized DUF497 family protein
VVIIAWDDSKQRANIAKHGLDFAALDVDFFAEALVGTARASRSAVTTACR